MTVDEEDRIRRAEEIQRYTENRCEALEKENARLSNSVTELTNSKTELENKVAELNKQIEKLKEILSFEEYREQFQKGKRTLLGKTINEWLIYQNQNERLTEIIMKLQEQIEKMKNCENCKHKNDSNTNYYCEECKRFANETDVDKWE